MTPSSLFPAYPSLCNCASCADVAQDDTEAASELGPSSWQKKGLRCNPCTTRHAFHVPIVLLAEKKERNKTYPLPLFAAK